MEGGQEETRILELVTQKEAVAETNHARKTILWGLMIGLEDGLTRTFLWLSKNLSDLSVRKETFLLIAPLFLVDPSGVR
jgi:hypothetical protein